MILKDVYARIEQRLSATGMSATAASIKAGLTRDAIRNIKRAADEPTRKGVSVRTIEMLAEALETTSEWLIRGAGPEKATLHARIQSAPLISWVRAGQMDVSENETDAQTVTFAGLPRSSYIALRVVGDSMDRVAPDGSIILVDTQDVDPYPGLCYIFALDDGSATFKRFAGKPSRFEPYSTNPTHEIIFPDGPWMTVGRVKRVMLDL